MPQQPGNVLNYMQQAGALKGYDPVQSQERATNVLGAQAGIEGQKLTSEMKRIEIGRSALKQVTGKDDYQGYRNFMVGKVGMNPELFPQSFEDDDKFEEWKGNTLLSVEQLIKSKQGEPFWMHKTNTDGSKVKVKVNSVEQLKRWKADGAIDKTWSLGEPIKSTKIDKPLKTWVTPDGETVNLPNTTAPPKGSTPYSATIANKDNHPYMAELMANGYVPTTRVTGPMLAAFEAAAKKAAEIGKPFTPKKMREYEFEAVRNKTIGRTAGSRLVVARKQNIKAAFELLDDMKKTQKQLKYSDVRFLGALQKFKNRQLNDPIFTEYMTQRADALFVLGNALKQNGLTDKSIEVEEEAADATLSPRAFDAWYNTQLRALNRAAAEIGEDYKYDIPQAKTFPPGQGGTDLKKMSDEELLMELEK